MYYYDLVKSKYLGMEIHRTSNTGYGAHEYNYYCPDIRESWNGYNVAKQFKSLSAVKAAIREYLNEQQGSSRA